MDLEEEYYTDKILLCIAYNISTMSFSNLLGYHRRKLFY